MVAELSALQQIISALTGLDGLPAVIVEVVVTTSYTCSYSGSFLFSNMFSNLSSVRWVPRLIHH